MKNERILIFGDSYSTFRDHVPEGFAKYYPHEDKSGTVDDVKKTWWHLLLTETGSVIVQNNSWSGSTICNTGYKGDCSKTSSFIHRLEVLTENGFFKENALDRVLVFGGTNDCWTKNTLGSLQFADWKAEDLLRVLPGMCFFFHRLCDVVAREKIHVIINTGLGEEIPAGLTAICKHFGLTYTQLEEIDKVSGHPTATGMKQIKEQVLRDLG